MSNVTDFAIRTSIANDNTYLTVNSTNLSRSTSVRGSSIKRQATVKHSDINRQGTVKGSSINRQATTKGSGINQHAPVKGSGINQKAPVKSSNINRHVTVQEANATPLTAKIQQPNKKKGYEIIHNGIDILYEPKNKEVEVDIVLIPGLGADPINCWKSETGFNWTSDEKGLRSDFPKSRIMLFKYESSWYGALKVDEDINNIAHHLLSHLKSKRENRVARLHIIDRPIVFIGHSMGGLVAVQSVLEAESSSKDYGNILQCLAGCIFFGTPFKGSSKANIGSTFAGLTSKLNVAVDSQLLQFMSYNNPLLLKTVDSFVKLANNFTTKIELFCFYETRKEDGFIIYESHKYLVTKDSACIDHIECMGLGCTHRDLVKFDSCNDERYVIVRKPIQKIINGSPQSIKSRFKLTRNIDRELVAKILDILDAADFKKKRKTLSAKTTPSSWISEDIDYKQWLSKEDVNTPENINDQRKNCLWIKGYAGRGKTRAILTALRDIEIISNDARNKIPFVYYLCDSSQDDNSAEKLLQSMIYQLIMHQESLADLAKCFVKHDVKAKTDDEDDNRKASQNHMLMTIENLWQVFQDMVGDFLSGERMFIVINNIHHLPADSPSTKKFLYFLREHFANLDDKNGIESMPIRWLITSQDTANLDQFITSQHIRLINLQDEKYDDKVAIELRRHAKQKIDELSHQRNYNKALSYYASTLIGRRAQNTKWIDITCLQLQTLPINQTDFDIKRVLESCPQNLYHLLHDTWRKVFNLNPNDVDKIKELLKTLVLTCEDPTEEELGLLAGITCEESPESQVKYLVDLCHPLVAILDDGRNRKIHFVDNIIKTHLLDSSAHDLIGLNEEEIKWHHGVMAHRCFSHLIENLAYESSYHAGNDERNDESKNGEGEDGEEEEEEEEGNDDDDDDDDRSWMTGESDIYVSERVEPNQEENIPETKIQVKVDDYDDDDNSKDDEEEEDEKTIEEAETTQNDEEREGTEDTDIEDSDDDFSSLCSSLSHSDTWEMREARDHALLYTIKHWLYHASQASAIAESLVRETVFWRKGSLIRRRWLAAYFGITHDLREFADIYYSFYAMHVAAAFGFRQLIDALIQNGHQDELKFRDGDGNTPLHIAAANGRADNVEELLSHGATIDDFTPLGYTPLLHAAESGKIEVMVKLLNKGANPASRDEYYGCVLNAAIVSGNQQAVKLIVDKLNEQGLPITDRNLSISASPLAKAATCADYAFFEFVLNDCGGNWSDLDYSYSLTQAAYFGRVNTFQKLIEYYQEKKAIQKSLETASEEGNWQIVEFILANFQGLDCKLPFFFATLSVEEKIELFEKFWEYTGGIDDVEFLGEQLYRAADYENEKLVRLFLNKFKIDANAVGTIHGNALTASAYDGTMAILTMLLEAGADVNSPNGWAIQTASMQGHIDIVQKLIDHGADVNALTQSEMFQEGTALLGACIAGHFDIVKLLLENGADPNIEWGTYASPLHAAICKSEIEIANLLLKAGANVNRITDGEENSSPLGLAAQVLTLPWLELFIEAGADIHFQDHDGDSALIMAAHDNLLESVKYLVEKGANILQTNKRNENALMCSMKTTACDSNVKDYLVGHVSLIFSAMQKWITEGNMIVKDIVQHPTKYASKSIPSEMENVSDH